MIITHFCNNNHLCQEGGWYNNPKNHSERKICDLNEIRDIKSNYDIFFNLTYIIECQLFNLLESLVKFCIL